MSPADLEQAAADDARTALGAALATDASRCIHLVRQSVQHIVQHHTANPAVQALQQYALDRTS
ncbi:hypothetical protein [Streptomyces sp. NPDC093094]|uniref:hypothetical protein n=1 Tax=Streptomyces sp. NPDC093094 TaxID=3366026 RepID=UPI003825AFFC